MGESIDAHRPRSRDATDVVAPEVDEHDVLGDLLLVVQQFVLEFEVFRLVDAASSRTRDGSVTDQSVVHAHQHLGRRTDDLNLSRIEKVHVGRGIEGPQHAIEREGIDGARPLELLTRHDLKDVAGEDVFSGPLDDVAVGRAGEIGKTLGDCSNVNPCALTRCRRHEALGRGVTRRLGAE